MFLELIRPVKGLASVFVACREDFKCRFSFWENKISIPALFGAHGIEIAQFQKISITMSAIFKFFSLCTVIFLFACGNSSNTGEQKQSSKKTATLPSDSLSKEALFSFVDGCIGDFKLALGEEKAFAFCKCMYDEIRKDNPDIDSVKLKAQINDSAQVNKMAANCR